MQIKQFTAPNMSAALQQIKKELGADAVILSAHPLKKRIGIFGNLKKAGVEVTAATDGHHPELYTQNSSTRPDNSYPLFKGHTDRARNYNRSGVSRPDNRTVHVDTFRKRPIRQSRQDERYAGKKKMTLYKMLVAQGVKDQYAHEMSSEINISLTPSPKDSNEVNIFYLVSVFKKMGIATRPTLFEKTKQQRVAFIGSSGAGKTSTIAKLATIYTTDMNRQVAVISLDNYSVAASDPLNVYARIIGIPFTVVTNEWELDASLDRFEHCDLVLIDTPAICTSEIDRLPQLKRLLKRINPDETHFVCSASNKEQDQLNLFTHLKGLSVNRLLFTKLDETTTYGIILNMMIYLQLPLSFIAGGQRIPECLESASPETLAQLIVRGRYLPSESSLTPCLKPDTWRTEKKFDAEPPNYYVGSKKSGVFHTRDCCGAKLIVKDNIIFFKSISDAEESNFKPCNTCVKKRLGRRDSKYDSASILAVSGMR